MEEAAMKQIIFALQFRGSASPLASGNLSAKTTARGQVLRTAIEAGRVSPSLEEVGGAAASFESEVQMLGDGAFKEWGSITYGSAGRVRFSTVGQGVMGTSGIDGLQRGAIIWEVTGGDGAFAGASGLITSNFSVDGTGTVIDNQFAQLFVE
jgi:hypothetical protein